MSLATAKHQAGWLAVHLTNGSSLLISKSLAPTGQVLKRLGTVLLIVGGLGVAVAAIAGGAVAPRGAAAGGTTHRNRPNGSRGRTTLGPSLCSAATNSRVSLRLSNMDAAGRWGRIA